MATMIPAEPWSMRWQPPETASQLSRPDLEVTRPPGARWSVLAYAPLAGAATGLTGGILGLLGLGPRFLRQRPLASFALAAGGFGLLCYEQLERLFLEQPQYLLECRVAGLEIRRYARRLVAETYVHASFDEAREEGFKRLAGYIFGHNFDQRPLARTTPVQVQRRVMLGTGYVVTFTLPRNINRANLPIPHDTRVLLRETHQTRVAVLRTHGSYRGEHVEAKMNELVQRARTADLAATGQPAFAAYDSPTTLPLLRRLELWLPIL